MATKKVKRAVKPEFPEEIYVVNDSWSGGMAIADKLEDAFDDTDDTNRVAVYKLDKCGTLRQTLKLVED